VRPVGVVLLPPRIQGGLQGLDGLELAVISKQLVLQRLVQPLDLPGSIACKPRRKGPRDRPKDINCAVDMRDTAQCKEARKALCT
jgi:hypothetical protein